MGIVTKSRMPRTTVKDAKYKKAPTAPKRFKSAYMFFSERKHKEFRQMEECKKVRTQSSLGSALDADFVLNTIYSLFFR
jgi:hypothetical protein